MIQRIVCFSIGRLSRIKVICLTFMLMSVVLNINFLFRPGPHEAWASKSKQEGMLKIMRFVELEREVDDVIKGEFVNRMWQCMKENLTAEAIIHHAADVFQDTHELTGTPSSHKSPDEFLEKPVVNLYDYTFLINQVNACSKGDADVIFASPSAPSNFERRMKMRSGEFGLFAQNPQNRARLLFFLGKPNYSEGQEPSSQIQEKIHYENAKYHDIVQATFLDSYKGFIMKGLLIPKWSSTFCPNSEFVIRVDDDVSANAKDLISALRKTREKHEHFVLGLLRTIERPVRKRDSKYFSSFEDFPYKQFPPYVLGGCMGYPVKTGELIFQACRRMQPVFWIDDVWISAMCASRVKVPVLDSPAFHFKHGDEWAH